jgi:hypothetical protein
LQDYWPVKPPTTVPTWTFTLPGKGITDTPEGISEKVPWTEHYKYLGSWLSHDGSVSELVKKNVTKAYNSFHACEALWSARHVLVWSKLHIFRTVVIPTLCYSLETVVLPTWAQELLTHTHTKMLARIAGLDELVDPWGRKYTIPTAEIGAITLTEPITDSIRYNRIRLAVRIARAAHGHPLLGILEKEDEEWMETVKNDLRELDLELEDLENKYKMSQVLHRRDPYALVPPRTKRKREMVGHTAQMAPPQTSTIPIQPARTSDGQAEGTDGTRGAIPLDLPDPCTIQWVGSRPRPDWTNKQEALAFLRSMGFPHYSFQLRLDERGKKCGPNRRRKVLLITDSGYYIECQNVLVVDIDGPTRGSLEFLCRLAGRCNCVARTRKGMHLLFQAHPQVRTNTQDRESMMDVRTGMGGILYVEPSCYVQQSGEMFHYKWVCIPAGAPHL